MHDTYTNCPYCGEVIKIGALKCKHCKSMIGEGDVKANSFNQIEVKENFQIPSASLLLLSKFLNGNKKNNFYGVEYWETALREKPETIIKNFIREGLLETAGLSEKINHKYKASDLKKILKERGLKVSGSKEELIQRLIDCDIKAMTEATDYIDLYQCTSTGKQLAEKYLTDERVKRESVEHEVLELLSQKEFLTAVQVVAQYEASQVFPRGMGIDWKNYDGKNDIEHLRFIFKVRPLILQDINDNLLDRLRLAVAMMFIWGKNSAKQWLPHDFHTGIHLDGDTACRMLLFHARHIRDIKENKETIALGIRIRSFVINGASDSCPECKELRGREYLTLEDVPELPYVYCTHNKGCRCIMLPNIL
jgi:hypothetical protein